MVRAQGIHTSTMIILGLVISNGLIALAGALIAQYQAFADVQMGIGSIVIGLASLIIGEVIIGTKSFHRVLIALPVGAVIYRMIIALVPFSAFFSFIVPALKVAYAAYGDASEAENPASRRAYGGS